MKNTLFVNHNNETIVMDRTFARKAINARSEEYELLQRVRQDYPKYTVTQRHGIMKDESRYLLAI